MRRRDLIVLKLRLDVVALRLWLLDANGRWRWRRGARREVSDLMSRADLLERTLTLAGTRSFLAHRLRPLDVHPPGIVLPGALLAVLVFSGSAVAVREAGTALASSRMAAAAAAAEADAQTPPETETETVPAPRLGAVRTVRVIQRGDTLIRLARAMGLDRPGDWRLLYAANVDLDDPSLLVIGTKLELPSAAEVARWRVAPELAAVVPPPGTPRVPEATWERLAQCESNGRWDTNTGNGYYGGLQFLPSSWELVGGRGMPHEADRFTQLRMAQRLLDVQGWDAWPECSRRLGLR